MPLNYLIFKNPLAYAMATILFALQFIFAERCIYPLIFFGAMGAIILTQNFFAGFDEVTNNNSHILKCLTYIGTKTLPVYLIHYYFIPNLTGIIGNTMQVGNPFIWQLLCCLVLTAPIIAASLVVERLIDRNPYLSWILFGNKFE